MKNINEEIEILRFSSTAFVEPYTQSGGQVGLSICGKNFTKKEAEELLETCDILSNDMK